jgi:hypothetical protein
MSCIVKTVKKKSEFENFSLTHQLAFLRQAYLSTRLTDGLQTLGEHSDGAEALFDDTNKAVDCPNASEYSC